MMLDRFLPLIAPALALAATPQRGACRIQNERHDGRFVHDRCGVLQVRALGALCLALAVASPALAQTGASPVQQLIVGIPNPLIITPIYAGSGNLSNGLTFNSPSPITAASHSFGYGTSGPEAGQLELSTNAVSNVMALTQLNASGFAALTFRGKDPSYPTLGVFEHGAIGYSAAGGNDYWEISRFDGTLNALIPPPSMNIMQTGGVDPTGGTNKTCTTTFPATPTILTCTTNAGANGTLITGTGIPVETTVVSGGGTTTVTMSNAATSANVGETVNFSSPVYAQYTTAQWTSGGNIDWFNWDGSKVLSLDRVNKRVGVGTAAPAQPLDVNGSIRSSGSLILGQSGISAGAWTTAGIAIAQSGGPYTDTSSSGTIAAEVINGFASPTLNANSATTVTNLSNVYINPPIAGTNVTATNLWGLNVNGKTLTSFLQSSAGINSFGGAATINVNSNFATNIGTGTTTQAVTIGGASNTTTVASAFDLTAIANAAGNEILCYNTSGGAVTYEPAVATCVPSVLRLKNPIGQLSADTAALKLDMLRPAVWTYKDTHTWGGQPYVGLYADDVAKMDSRCGVRDKAGKLENYADRCVLAYLVAAVQGQQREIAELKAALRRSK